MATEYKVIYDSWDKDGDGIAHPPAGARYRELHLEVTGVNTTPEPIMPSFRGRDFMGMSVTMKNTGAQALSATEIYYGIAEGSQAVVLDDSKDHWEKETGFDTLAAGATLWAIMTHPMPAYCTLKSKTPTGTTSLEVRVTLCLRP